MSQIRLGLAETESEVIKIFGKVGNTQRNTKRINVTPQHNFVYDRNMILEPTDFRGVK